MRSLSACCTRPEKAGRAYIESRAAPLQGADSGRPSGSSEVRGVGQDRSKRPSIFTQNRKLPEVPSSVTSSGERYDRTGQNIDARTKSSTYV